jgi:NADH-quinone oxidoreductase subunit N
MTALDLRPLVPSLIVALTALVVLLTQAFTPKGSRAPSALLSVFGLAGALLATIAMIVTGRGRGSSLGAAVTDDFALFFHVLLLGIGILAVLLSPSYLQAVNRDRGEYYTLLLFSIVGMLGMSMCRELVSIFVALEIMSVAMYALCGMRPDREESTESAVKYFVTGAFSSAFFLYGVALIYGATGSTSLPVIEQSLALRTDSGAMLAVLGTAFLVVGFGFKVASVPFHMWAPDVYEGAPTTVTALMSAGVKAAAFSGLLRVFLEALPALGEQYWQPAAAVLAVVSMVIGNLGALAQTNLKRMLAYSSIAHAGYVMTALVAQPQMAVPAMLYYLVAYAAVSIGGFGLMSALARGDGREPLTAADLAGLGTRRPALAAAMTVFLVSLTGLPVSGGFVGKFYLFSAAVSAGATTLAIVGMLMSVVSAYYYLRVVVAMYFQEPSHEEWAPVSLASGVALAVSAFVTLALGVYPAPLMAWAGAAAASLR